MSDSTIHQDVQDAAMMALDGDDATGFDAFLANVSDDPKRKPGSTTDTEGEAGDTDTAAGQDPETTESDGQTDTPTTTDDPDDYEVEIKVGEETKKATLRDLKRLYGQEASLTQKSQKLADDSRVASAQSNAAQVALNTLLQRAKARYEPFSGLDPMILAKELDSETFAAYRKEEATAKADVDFLTSELHNAVQAESQRAQRVYADAAQSCIKVLSDEATGIKGWGKELYEGLMTYADGHGLGAARQLVDPAALKLLHKAYLYDQGQKAAAAAVNKAQRAVNNPARTLRPGAAADRGTQASTKYNAAITRLRNSGSEDDAVDAFMASLNRD